MFEIPKEVQAIKKSMLNDYVTVYRAFRAGLIDNEGFEGFCEGTLQKHVKKAHSTFTKLEHTEDKVTGLSVNVGAIIDLDEYATTLFRAFIEICDEVAEEPEENVLRS